MQPIRFSLYSLWRRRPSVAFEDGREIGPDDLFEVLKGNQRLVAEVRQLAEEIAAGSAIPSPIDLHIPLLNGRTTAPPLDDAVVERKGRDIYVLAIPNQAALAGYSLSLACLMRVEKNVIRFPSRWLDAPTEESRMYKPVYRHVSRILQENLREHLPATWFSYTGSYDATSASHAMLMYKASPCAAGPTRQTICRDLLSPKSVNGIFHVTRWTLPPVLAEVHRRLKAEGYPRAHLYRPSLAEGIIEKQRKLGSAGRTILLVEQEIINATCTAGVRYGELMARETTINKRRSAICRISEDLTATIAASLGRFVRPKDRLQLTLTLMNEATRALAQVVDAERQKSPFAA